MNNIKQLRGLSDQANAIAKAHGAKGAFIMLDYGDYSSIGTDGLTFQEQINLLSVGIHWSFEFAERDD